MKGANLGLQHDHDISEDPSLGGGKLHEGMLLWVGEEGSECSMFGDFDGVAGAHTYSLWSEARIHGTVSISHCCFWLLMHIYPFSCMSSRRSSWWDLTKNKTSTTHTACLQRQLTAFRFRFHPQSNKGHRNPKWCVEMMVHN